MPKKPDLKARVASLETQFGQMAEAIGILAKAQLTSSETSTMTDSSTEKILSIFALIENPAEQAAATHPAPKKKAKAKKAPPKKKKKGK